MIPNKELSVNEFKKIINYHKINFGGEAIICESDNPKSLYKIFTHTDSNPQMSTNKIIKINSLYDLKPLYSIEPICTLSLNDVIIGYEMSTDIELTSYKLHQLSLQELKYFLLKTKEILEYFTSIGIIYGDINPRNILFNRNTGEIKFCDMDNISIGGIPIDLLPYSLDPFIAERKIDNSVHPYMHNIMTLKAFELDTYCSKKQDIKKYFKRPAIKIVSSMIKPKNFTGEYIVSNVKK